MNPFKQLIGQPQAVELLTQSVIKNRVAPAYLFIGAPGIGKRLGAKCFIELIFNNANQYQNIVNHPDLLWVEPIYQDQGQLITVTEATAKGLKYKVPPAICLEQIRGIIKFLSHPPLKAHRQVVVISNAEKILEGAANALLKVLEEPGKATIILTAPSPDLILPTLVSRCHYIPFYRLNITAMAQVLKQTGNQEILQHPMILNISVGSPGEAITYYKKLQSISSELLSEVTKMPYDNLQALEMAKQISRNLDIEVQLWLIDYLQHFYWRQGCKRIIVQNLEQARNSLLCHAQPRLVWECTFLKMLI
ncbi:DNA polymerase III delta prime subunit [Richelia intracellularis HH01]|uniref:DNA polymerase III delta prime subunit n=1 Tax=Richelia intracellularis HH01 TaxID=1165094 RepID=M1X6J3_9NOST|nr:DNA polymerase III subunit delta' [Richelia intracellularis]CCH68186.1 DNA polymerase III delta prime subunit [Richelia intracellularis HH01]HAE06546.1 DNA polymerase III subunit delta' [Richelia sp.]